MFDYQPLKQMIDIPNTQTEKKLEKKVMIGMTVFVILSPP